MDQTALISIIMPVYNAGKYIKEAIRSVTAQTYNNWELLIVNDGSTDASEEIIQSFSDPRIKYFSQPNKGVSAARNLALKNMKGAFFCFLDADDVLPEKSLEARYRILLENNNVGFADGIADTCSEDLSVIINTYTPCFKGLALYELLQLNGSCYFGNTWMIRRDVTKSYAFDEKISHAEDLIFYLSIAQKGLYDYSNETVLKYRTGQTSAMTDLKGLEQGYVYLLEYTKQELKPGKALVRRLKIKITSIMVKSYLKKGDLPAAIKALKFLFR
jgi:teichuronic acid biosynthesis glycosyltransferase TuaG